MFESILTATETTISAIPAIIIIIEGFVLGILIASCYMFSQKLSSYSKEYIVTLAVLPAIVSLIIMLVGSSVARALSLAGAFALVRFRSAQGTAKEIAFVFFSMAIGLACGLGFIFFAPIAAVLICTCLFIICKSKFGEKKSHEKLLKITIPEDLNYNGLFDDLFKEYTKEYVMKQVRTTNMGTLYELSYYIVIKDRMDEKQFIDSIRCRNGNLNISIGMLPDRNEATL